LVKNSVSQQSVSLETLRRTFKGYIQNIEFVSVDMASERRALHVNEIYSACKELARRYPQTQGLNNVVTWRPSAYACKPLNNSTTHACDPTALPLLKWAYSHKKQGRCALQCNTLHASWMYCRLEEVRHSGAPLKSPSPATVVIRVQQCEWATKALHLCS